MGSFRFKKKHQYLKCWPGATVLTTKKSTHQFTLMRAIEPEKKSILPKEVFCLEDGSRLFVGGIPVQVTKQELTCNFAGFGPLKSINLSCNESSPELNKGFGFVVFENGTDAQKVLCHSRNHVLRSKVVGSTVGRSPG